MEYAQKELQITHCVETGISLLQEEERVLQLMINVSRVQGKLKDCEDDEKDGDDCVSWNCQAQWALGNGQWAMSLRGWQ